jgi:outer membrane protein
MSLHPWIRNACRRARAAAALLLLGVLAPAPSMAQPAAAQPKAPTAAKVQSPAASGPTKVAVIDVERILLESKRGKKALAEIDTLRKQKQQEKDSMQKEIADLRQKIKDGQLSLSEGKLADLKKQLEDKLIALQRFQDDAQRDLSKKRDDVLDQIEKSVFPVINKIGAEGGYTLIFNKYRSGLVYASDAVDITEQVIARYNQTTSGQ